MTPIPHLHKTVLTLPLSTYSFGSSEFVYSELRCDPHKRLPPVACGVAVCVGSIPNQPNAFLNISASSALAGGTTRRKYPLHSKAIPARQSDFKKANWYVSASLYLSHIIKTSVFFFEMYGMLLESVQHFVQVSYVF